MDGLVRDRHNPGMGRRHHAVYAASRTPRYIVIWTLHWSVVEVEVLAPMADLAAAMSAALARLHCAGWTVEASAGFGFTFIHRDGERRLVVITARDPASAARQSFDPFRGA
jgi:hypothetical protein